MRFIAQRRSRRAPALAVAALFGALLSAAVAEETMSTAAIISPVMMSQPAYLEPATDPAFGVEVIRVTDPVKGQAFGLSCGSNYCTHRYSSAQAWNADQSLLVIANGCGGLCFLDGRTYRPLFHRRSSGECEWHPTDAALMICVEATEVLLWNPRLDTKTSVFQPADYVNLQFGPYKGNASSSGERLVLRAMNSAGALVAFAYDIAARRKFPDIDLAALPGKNGYCSISPSGRYVFCAQTKSDDTEIAYVFTVEGDMVQHWLDHHRPGHGDMAIDDDGADIYVGVSKADPDKYHVIKRRLDNGAIVDLTPYGEGQHASLRNIRRPGWVFLSYAGDYYEIAAHPSWAPFYREVVALRTDGTGRIRRIAQTRNEPAGYWSETHASPSPDGSQVIWSSNWGRAGGFVADYVTRVPWPDERSQK